MSLRRHSRRLHAIALSKLLKELRHELETAPINQSVKETERVVSAYRIRWHRYCDKFSNAQFKPRKEQLDHVLNRNNKFNIFKWIWCQLIGKQYK